MAAQHGNGPLHNWRFAMATQELTSKHWDDSNGNLFDIEPFVKRLERAFRLRRQERDTRKRVQEAKRQGDADE